MAMQGSIHLVLGPMFSGKTDEIIRQHVRQTLRLSNGGCLVFKYAGDTRYSKDEKVLVSLSGASVKATPISSLEEGDALVQSTRSRHIIIDEGQFYGDLVKYCTFWADSCGCRVVVSALDGDAKKKPWESVSALMPHCDTIVKLSAICNECGADAPFSSRKKSDNTERVQIGSTDKYEALCRHCYKVENDIE